MYKALHIQSGEEIIILSPGWRRRIEELRYLDREDQLVCQGCLQPLRVKSGDVKRPHFAHKHLKACSYGVDSPEILAARAVLYEWLEIQFGSSVTVEKKIDVVGLPRPVDCWVETDAGIFAYWIIEAGIKLEPRENILSAFRQMGVKSHWIFLQQMLNEEKKEFHSLLLTPTERAFLQTTEIDRVKLRASGEAGFTIHYLDPEQQKLTTYRELALFHRPNWYKGVKRTSSLEDIRVHRVDGEMVHPGEMDRLRKFNHQQKKMIDKLKAYQERESTLIRHPRQTGWENVSKQAGQAEPPRDPTLPELVCVDCGHVTIDYWASFTTPDGRRVCRCRECLNRSSE